MKIVINRCHGGFGISREAAEFLASALRPWAVGDWAVRGKLPRRRHQQRRLLNPSLGMVARP